MGLPHFWQWVGLSDGAGGLNETERPFGNIVSDSFSGPEISWCPTLSDILGDLHDCEEHPHCVGIAETVGPGAVRKVNFEGGASCVVDLEDLNSACGLVSQSNDRPVLPGDGSGFGQERGSECSLGRTRAICLSFGCGVCGGV